MTRWGVLADVHGNLPALRVAVGTLRASGVDGYLCAGDTVGYGPHPNECIAALAELGALSVAGNHELFLLGELGPEGFPPRARQSLEWTREVLEPAAWAFLRSLPRWITVPAVVVAHGSLDDPQEYVTRSAQAARQLACIDRWAPGSRILVLGHTHRQLRFETSGRRVKVRPGITVELPRTDLHLLNPGSVGQSREWELAPRVRFMELDVGRRQVRWFAHAYDDRATRRDLARAGLSPGSVHVRPVLRRSIARAIRRLAG